VSGALVAGEPGIQVMISGVVIGVLLIQFTEQLQLAGLMGSGQVFRRIEI
jgi:preprotein translocase subunit SecG